MPTTQKKSIRVRKGQMWLDGDRRERGNRTLTVVKVRKSISKAVIRNQETGKETEAGLHRFNNYANGYILLADVSRRSGARA